MTVLNRWLTPPVFADEEQTRLANLLHWMLIFLVVVNLVDAALLLVFAPETLPTFWMNGVFLAFTLVAYGMMRAGRVRSGALLVCLSLWALLVGYLAISGGVTSPATGLFAVIIIVSAVMLGVQGALGFGFLCIASAAILYWFGSNGWLTSIEQTPTPARMFATQTAIFLILTLLMTVSGRTVWDALRRARADERALAERNQQLQQEIAQRERAQQSQERLVAIVEATSDMIAMSDLQGKLIHLNQGGRRLVGIGRDDDVTCTHITDYHPAAYSERIFSEAIPTALREGTWSGETMLRTRDGRDLPVSQVVIAHRNAAGDAVFLSTVMRDISDRKQAEQQRLELAVEEERLASFKEFLSTISHDLKTPMTVILTGLELLARIEDPEHRKEKLAHIGQEMALLQTYIDDLLVLTRLDRLPDLTFVPLNVNRLLHDAETHVAPAAVEKGIALRLRAHAGLPAILGHERDIYRALTNLIENAIHYTHAGGSVTVSARSDESDVVIEVADSGIGIDPAEVDRVFERFYRSRQAQAMRSNGTGLGLAIVKRIVEVHAGMIEVESTPGVGTTFRIRLPLAQA